MSKPGEHKTVHPPSLKLRRTGARILAYAETIGWTMVAREESEQRRGGIPAPLHRENGDRNVTAPLLLFFDELLDAKVREFNPRYAESEARC
jgi:type I restriction enzyme R subunit